MIRAGLISLIALAAAPSAHADPRPLGRADHVAVSGDAAILARAAGGRATVTRAPLTGGPATQLLDVKAKPYAVSEVAASPQRVAVAIGNSVYAGPATGPLKKVGGGTYGIAVTGDTVLLFSEQAITALAPDGTRTPVDLPEDAHSVNVAGDFLSYEETLGNEPEDEPGLHVRVRNWRTGEQVRSMDFKTGMGIVDSDLRDDGGLLLELDDGHMHTLLPDGMLRDLGRDPAQITGAHHVWAGDGYTVPASGSSSYATPRFATADGKVSAFGLPSDQIQELASDGQTAVWQANGCAITAAVTDPVAGRYEGSGCRLSEVSFEGPYTKGHTGRTDPVDVRCLVAKSGRCRGTITSKGLRHAVRVSIPVGTVRTLRLPVAASALRKARRDKGGALKLRTVLDDGRPSVEIHPIG